MSIISIEFVITYLRAPLKTNFFSTVSKTKIQFDFLKT